MSAEQKREGGSSTADHTPELVERLRQGTTFLGYNMDPLAREAADEIERLRALNADMLAALLNVRKLISEAAMTGFNCHDGDWAERLFTSQQITSRSISAALADRPADATNLK